MLSRLRADLRFGLRQLLARPGFTLAATLTLALGIGANVLVFALIDAVFLGPLPYRDAAALVQVYSSSPKFGGGVDTVSIPDYVDLKAGVPALADAALYTGASFNLADAGAAERLDGLRVTPSLFSTLGVGAALGRVFGADAGTVGHDRVAVLSDALWRNRFDADPQIVGRGLRLDGEDYRVIGVLPPGFMFPDTSAGVFVPFAFTPDQLADDQRGVNYSSIVARLQPGASIAQVGAQAAAVLARNAERIGATGADGAIYAHEIEESGFHFGARPLREQLSGRNAGELVLLQAAVALVLLIALANTGNLLLTRLSARGGELAVRSALGARRADVARQLLVEAALLAGAGAALGFAAAWAGARAVAASDLLPAWVHFALDYRTFAFTAVITIAATCAFGLAPALLSARPAPAPHESRRLAGGSRAARRLRAALVVVQFALALALLAGAGLLLRSFTNAAAQSPGFVSDHVLTARLSLPAAKYPDQAAQARALRAMLDAARALPGVDAAAATTRLPFGGANAGLYFQIEGRANPDSPPHAALRLIDEDYFRAMGIPLLRGRAFTRADWETRARAVVVDANFVRRYFPAGDALGKRLTLGMSPGGDAYTIVGVVGSVKHFDLTAPATQPTYYFDLGARASDSVFLVVRARAISADLVDALRAAVRSVDPEQPLFDISLLDARIASSLTGRRVPLQLIGLFAGCALLLAAVGIYAVLAFAVQQRTAEIGLRMAIGADAARVRREVLAGGSRLAAIGIGAGLLGALAAGFLLRSRLFGVAPVDARSLAAVTLVLAATALAACWLPARRAARLDPIVALRHE
jgi:putative ABC transport system permease protein